jgi:hypothetical protein
LHKYACWDAGLLQLTYILKKCSLQVQKRIYRNFFAVSVKTNKSRPLRVPVIGTLYKIKCLEKIVFNGNAPVFVGLSGVQPKAEAIDPVMNPRMQGI